MPRLKLGLLGPPQVEVDDTPVEIKRRKALALLAYLALSDGPQRRDSLAALLWPDSSQRRARGALRRHLSELNQLLGGDWLETDRETVSLRHSPDLNLDVAQFRTHLAACRDHGHPAEAVCPACLPRLVAAADLYRADFLSGFTLSDSPEFDDWQYFQAESLRQELSSVLDRLAQGYREQGDSKTAIGYARRWLTLDPLHEPAHRELMRLYAQSGQQTAALRQYQACLEMLQTEFGTSPNVETTALYEQIRRGERPADIPVSARVPSPDFLIGGRYEIIDQAENLIGHGSMGHVFKGRDTHSGKTVAIKVLRAELLADEGEGVERFVREGAALRRLNHPNIVQLLDVIAEAEQHYLVMEYVAGGSLRELLDQSEPLSLERVLQIGLELVDALTQTHYQGIIHRDIKPDNILLDAAGRPRLTDFGVARLGQAERLTQTGAVIGTLDYLSPEALNGAAVDARTDIWSLGVLLYELLGRSRPFTGETLTEVLTAILTRPAPDLAELRPDVPPALAALIDRMLSKEPAERIGSVRQVGAKLETILQAVQVGAPAAGRPTDDLSPQAGPPRHNLSVQPTAFVGRAEELAQITVRLAEVDCRLLTLVGPGGSGKTRLALEAARAQLDHFPQGVFFVSLVGLDAPAEIVLAIAEAVGFSFYQGTPPQQQLLAYLSGKSLLLLLDNFEHLLAGASLLVDILQAAPEVRLLVTSRARLNLAAEQVYPLAGLAYPAVDQLAAAADFQAVQLFADRAGRVRPDFALTAANLAAVSRICRLVAGMPLAIILAAAWVSLLEPGEIAGEIEQGLDLLESDVRDLPARQRSMRAVFDQSWRLLSATEQAVLGQLSVFRGRFTRQAAQAVTGCALRTLLNLVDRSFVQRSTEGDFQLHELLRQYAGEQLQQNVAEETAARDRHSAYYLAYLAEREAGLKGSRQMAAFGELIAAADNIRVAWGWAARHGRYEWLEPAIQTLGWFHEWRCHYAEGASLCRQAIAGLVGSEEGGLNPPSELVPCLVGLVAWQACLTEQLGDTQACDVLYERGLALLRGASGNSRAMQAAKAFLLLAYAFRVYARDGPVVAGRMVTECLALYRALGDRWGMAFALFLSGDISNNLGDQETARGQLEESLHLWQASGDELMMRLVRQVQASVALEQEQPPEEVERLLLQVCEVAERGGSARDIGMAQSQLGEGYLALGRFADARQPLVISRDSNQEAGHRVGADWGNLDLSELAVHGGEYEQAQQYLQQLCTQETGVLEATACIRGAIALAQGEFAAAARQYGRGLPLARQKESPDRLGKVLVGLAYAARGLGEYERAWQLLREAGQSWLTSRKLAVSLRILSLAAHLLADREELVQAVELYALASRYPYVANSRWYEDITGRQIAAAAAELPAEVVKAAQERGRARDLNATITALLAEFEGLA